MACPFPSKQTKCVQYKFPSRPLHFRQIFENEYEFCGTRTQGNLRIALSNICEVSKRKLETWQIGQTNVLSPPQKSYPANKANVEHVEYSSIGTSLDLTLMSGDRQPLELLMVVISLNIPQQIVSLGYIYIYIYISLPICKSGNLAAATSRQTPP